MRLSKDDQGNLLFAPTELLNYKQIASIFSRLAAEQRKGTVGEGDVARKEKKTKKSVDVVDALFEQEGDVELVHEKEPLFQSTLDMAHELVKFNEHSIFEENDNADIETTDVDDDE